MNVNPRRLSTVTGTGSGSVDEMNSRSVAEDVSSASFLPKATKNCDEELSNTFPT